MSTPLLQRLRHAATPGPHPTLRGLELLATLAIVATLGYGAHGLYLSACSQHVQDSFDQTVTVNGTSAPRAAWEAQQAGLVLMSTCGLRCSDAVVMDALRQQGPYDGYRPEQQRLLRDAARRFVSQPN